jgi:hypothetical protein
MSWQCHCGCINVNLTKYCNYCRVKLGKATPRPTNFSGEADTWDEIVRERHSSIIDRAFGFDWSRFGGENPMTPQEELYIQLFNHEKILVKDMTTLERRAHREELVKIAFEARTRIRAVDHAEEEEIKARRKADGPTGFARSVNVDETATDAINTIKERQKRLSKEESKNRQKRVSKEDKIKESLYILGLSESEVDKVMSAGTVLAKVKSNAAAIAAKEQQEVKPIFNPFEKKE